MGDLLQPWHLIILFVVGGLPAIVLGVIPFWFICKKAGFSPFLTFLNLVPFCLGTLVLVYLLAFGDWKAMPASQLPAQPPRA